MLPELPKTAIFLLKWLSKGNFIMSFPFLPKIIPGVSFLASILSISLSLSQSAVQICTGPQI